MAATNLRFVILGDDRGSSAFNRFARSVNDANKAIDRNNAALGRSGKASATAQSSLLGLAGAIAGVDAAAAKSAGSMSTFHKVLLGVNLATGILEPVAAELAVAMGTITAAAAGAAVGLGAYGLAVGGSLTKVSKAFAAQQAAITKTPAAIAKYKAALAALTPAQTAFFHAVENAKNTYVTWADKLSAPVLGPLTRGLTIVKPLLADLSPLVRSASAAIGYLVDRLGKNITGGGFAKWLAAIRPTVAPVITGLGIAIGHIVVGLGGVIKAFAPFVSKFVNGLDSITAKFAKWGQTLTSHSGFQSLIGLWTKSGPQVNKIFSNLVTILANVGKNMAGLATPANSAALINILTPLSSIIAKLSQNQGLVKFVLYFLLLKSTISQVTGPLKSAGDTISGITGAISKGSSAFTAFKAGFVNSAAAASSATGVWGSTGGAIADVISAVKGWTIWSKIAAKATVVWTVVQKALNFAFKDNPIGLVITAIGLLVAAVIYAYTHFKWFRDFVNLVWKGIQIEAIATWHVINDVWRFIITAGKDVWHALQAGWTAVWHAVVDVARWFADRIMGFFGILLHGAAAAFGWIPVIGDKLKDAAAAFDRFHARVDKALSFKDKSVTIGVGFGVTLPGGKTFTGQAAGGLITGGMPGRDSVPGLLMPGEVVVPAHMVRAGAVDHLRGRLPRFAAGGLVGGGFNVQSAFPSVPAMAAAAMAVIKHLAQKNIGALFGGLGAGGTGVARWAGVILTALRLLRQSPGWLGLVERRMNQESGGNPTIVNKWDSNWAAGTPSVGLMQVIGPTFAAYAGPFRNTGPFEYGTSVNPLANVYAGLNYALHRYGTLAALGQPGGYDRGGFLPPGLSLAWNGTGRPEPVGAAAGGGVININVTVAPGGEAEAGRKIVNLIRAYEATATAAWRSRGRSA